MPHSLCLYMCSTRYFYTLGLVAFHVHTFCLQLTTSSHLLSVLPHADNAERLVSRLDAYSLLVQGSGCETTVRKSNPNINFDVSEHAHGTK